MQSTLIPAGREAELMVRVLVWMTIGGGLIWLIVMLLAWYAPRAAQRSHARVQRLLIVGGGVLFPTVVLLVLMISGLKELPSILAPSPDNSLTLEVTGAQWWWRVRYLR